MAEELAASRRSGSTLLYECCKNSKPLSLLHFQIRKSPQVPRIHVRDGPEFESIAIPMQNIIAVLGETLHGFSGTGFRGRDEQIDNMFITLVDERSDFATIYIIQPATGQTEAAIGEI